MGLSKRKRVSITISIILIVTLSFTYLGYNKFFKPAPVFGMPVEAAEINSTAFEQSINAIGTLQANEFIIIRPEVAGRVAEILFKEGQVVSAGTPLIKLEDSIAAAAFAEISADFTLSKAEYERVETVLSKGGVSVNERDIKLAKYQSNEAAKNKAEALMSKMTLKAPFTGIIGIRKVSPGDFVNVGQEIANLVDINSIKVDFQIPEIYIKDIKEGQTIEVLTDSYKDKVFTGTIYAIDPAIDPISHSILIRAKLNNDDKYLKPGLFVQIKLITKKLPDAILIPDQAVVLMQGKQYVYKIKDGLAALTEVTLGERHNNQVLVINGLTNKEIIITSGHMKIGPNSKVMPINLSQNTSQQNKGTKENTDPKEGNK